MFGESWRNTAHFLYRLEHNLERVGDLPSGIVPLSLLSSPFFGFLDNGYAWEGSPSSNAIPSPLGDIWFYYNLSRASSLVFFSLPKGLFVCGSESCASSLSAL